MGAGVALAAAALIALATLSVVLAVGGWPKGHFVQREGSVALQAQRAAEDAAASAGATPPALVATRKPRAARGASRPGHVRTVARHQSRRPATSGPGTKAIAPVTSSPSGATAPSGSTAGGGSSGGSTSGSGSGLGTPVTNVTGTVGTTVTSVTDTAGQVLTPVSQPVADTVTTVGQQAGQTVDQIGQTVGGVVGGLTGGLK